MLNAAVPVPLTEHCQGPILSNFVGLQEGPTHKHLTAGVSNLSRQRGRAFRDDVILPSPNIHVAELPEAAAFCTDWVILGGGRYNPVGWI